MSSLGHPSVPRHVSTGAAWCWLIFHICSSKQLDRSLFVSWNAYIVLEHNKSLRKALQSLGKCLKPTYPPCCHCKLYLIQDRLEKLPKLWADCRWGPVYLLFCEEKNHRQLGGAVCHSAGHRLPHVTVRLQREGSPPGGNEGAEGWGENSTCQIKEQV